MASKNQVGMTLFALGRAGHIHANNMLQNRRVDLRYIVEEDTAKAEKYLLDNHSNAKVLSPSNASLALEDPAVSAVVVCTPTLLHEECVLMSLKAGKPVFCEKPIAITVEAAAACYDEAEKVGVPLYCAFNRRFDPGHRSVIQAAQDGKVGRIHIIKQTSRDPSAPSQEYIKISNGIFHDCGIHDIDVALTITGEAPTTVYAQAHSFIPHIGAVGDVDAVAITLKFPSGTLAQIDLDRFASYGYDQRLEVFGDKGMMLDDNRRPTAVQFLNEQGATQDPNLYSFPQRYAEAYANELDHFIDVVLGKAEMEVTRHQVILACQVANACDKSLHTGQVVKFQNDTS